METLHVLVLGVVQGLTEFLPVSSSGHLLVVRQLFGWADEGLAFDAALHLGTLLAILVYFRRTWAAILRGREGKLLGLLVLGTVPGALAGFLGESFIATYVRGLTPIGIFFLATAVLLFVADRRLERRTQNPELTTQSSLLIGIAQAFALLPGLSRSGATIAAGMLLGLPRPQAVEFSFLLALPITAAAGLEGLRQLAALAPEQIAPMGIGLVAAFVTGTAAITFLLRTIRTRTFLPYALYLLIAGVLVLFLS